MARVRVARIARNDLARVFLFREGSNLCQCPVYTPCFSVDGLSQDKGDITKVECPDPYNYGQFIEVASIPGELSRMTTSITTHMSQSEASEFYDWFLSGCSYEVHIHFGECNRPNEFNQFEKAVVLKDVQVTGFNTDALVALQSGDRATITETIDVSASAMFNYVPVVFGLDATVANSTARALGVKLADSCEICTCGFECSEVVQALEDANALTVVIGAGVLGTTGYVIDSAGSMQLIDLTDSSTSTGGVAATETLNDSETKAIYGAAVGENGYVAIWDSSFNLTELSTGNADNLVEISLSTFAEFNLIGSDGGNLYVFNIEDEEVLQINSPTTDAITASRALNENSFLIGTDMGELWCTSDCGVTWSEVKYPGTQGLQINDIEFTESTIYVAVGDRILTSYDKACTFQEEVFDVDEVIDIEVCYQQVIAIMQNGADAVVYRGE